MKLGILGGGQLAKMMLPHAHRLGIETTILDDPDAVASGLATYHIAGSFQNSEDIKKLSQCDSVTIEIENVSIEGLESLEKLGIKVRPSSNVIKVIQDKSLQKKFFEKNSIPTSPFSVQILSKDGQFPNSVFIKLCRGGYDGKGVWNPQSDSTPPDSFINQEVVVEDKVAIKTEVSQLIARSANGEIMLGPAVEMVFNPELNLIDSAFLPTDLAPQMKKILETIAKTIVEKLNYVGVMAIECFVTADNKLLVNELAPRPHNSGHGTIEACACDQFEQHLRAVCSLPLLSWGTLGHALTFNLIGQANGTKTQGPPLVEGLEKVLQESNAFVHLYGKKQCRIGRKMGHVTLVDDASNDAKDSYHKLMQKKKRIEQWIKVMPQ